MTDVSGLRASDWTTIIPVAGKGTRLGHDAPKVLYPVLGVPMAIWLFRLFAPVCSRIVWVVSESGRDAIATCVRAGDAGFDQQFAIQAVPLGMADAVACGVAHVATPNCLVVWGDQIVLRRETIDAARRGVEIEGAAMAWPTVRRSNPYIHVVRDASGAVEQVLQAREGEIMPREQGEGESDTGLFAFRAAALRNVLERSLRESLGIGTVTGERNLLPLLPLFEQEPGGIITVTATDGETQGINTPAEAELVATILQSRSHS